MSASQDFQEAVSLLLPQDRVVTFPDHTQETIKGIEVPILRRRPKELQSDIEAEIAKQKIAAYVMPPLPRSALQGVPFVFFDKYELRVRFVEQPKTNDSGTDAYDLMERCSLLLQWTNPANMLAYPLALATTPVEMVEDPEIRIIDVIFNAVMQQNF
jgi:hypothetical protein